MNGIPIGVQDFIKIREKGLYYVDKSRLISEILDRRGTEVFQFNRPRRFGKSTNLSMLDAYFNKDYSGNDWFDELEISELRPSDPEKNAHPVLHLDLKDLGNGDYDVFLRRLSRKVSDLCMDFLYLEDSDRLNDVQKERFDSYYRGRADPYDLSSCLRDISSMLSIHHGTEVIILIDEYDDPLNRAYGKDDQRQILDFIRDMLSAGLKGNGSLDFAVVTGVMHIARESLFSGFNNASINNVLSTDMDEMFGFTSEEVQRICSDFGRPDRFGEAREWYDGYHFGDADVYNPWSIMNYVGSGFKPDGYWTGTSGNSIIEDLLSSADGGMCDMLVELGSGGTVTAEIDPMVTYADISELGEGTMTVLVLSGYLTAYPVGGVYSLRIPNREMFAMYADILVKGLGRSGAGKPVRTLSRALLDGDVGSLGRCMEDLLKSVVSGRVLDNEHSYQAFVAGLFTSLLGSYRITADFESGDGYHDIRMERLAGSGPNILMEFKRSGEGDPSEESMRGLAEQALEQIRDRDYTHGLKGRTLLYGVAFDGKRPTIVSDSVVLR